MVTAKEAIQRLIATPPDDATWEDVQYSIYVRERIERGRREANEGKTVDQNEISDDRDLPIPNDVAVDPNAEEVFRAWVANGQLVCAMRPLRWKDSSAWGILLADAARHVANAIRDEIGIEPNATVTKIRNMFNDELTDPTDKPTGSFPK
jgi:hypothetical protein